MHRICITAVIMLLTKFSFAQQPVTLTVEKIMRDPKWIGTSPSSPQWDLDNRTLYFNYNPDKSTADSLYLISTDNKQVRKATVSQKQNLVSRNAIVYNQNRTCFVYAKDGDIFYTDIKIGKTRRITQTVDVESNPQFSFNQTKIVYNRSQNLYAWDIVSGETMQLTNIRTAEGSTPVRPPGSFGNFGGGGNTGGSGNAGSSTQEDWLKKDQLRYMEVLRTRKEKKDEADLYTRNTKQKELRSISIADKILQGLNISPDGRFISYSLFKAAPNTKTTIVPNYVTETGFTADIPARTKVGVAQGVSEFFIYDRDRDTVWTIKTDSIEGIRDIPSFYKDYPKVYAEKEKKPANRPVSVLSPQWSPNGRYVILDIRSGDNKDRWLMRWDTASRKLILVDRQHDEAWIGGPGLFGGIGWINENTCWFQSEATGYSHLYTFNVETNEKKSLTAGKYEVLQARLSNDKKSFYLTTNEVHPGEQHFYRLNIATGKQEKLTSMTGSNQVSLSPDEKYLAIIYSFSNKPWELYLQENKSGSKPEQITTKGMSEEFSAYNWRVPELISFTARDGAQVYARVYKPANPHPSKPAVLFVHGAGYLQNAHKWWSQYFREFMFNNMLADHGYYVMDIDYRGSAGYGRDWRTGIYRFMGGKDLSDHVDAVDYMVKNFGVNPKNVGLYGGSYGGFITLMGMFNEPGTFKSGAALRPVTDWANYNHGYTSNILNEPFNDSIAYRKSSPYYFAEGLKGNLLICHGMVDVNVHYQDAIKLTQRLIELGKDNWELASYPMEDHGFVEPSSWTDEYKRIFKLFEGTLKRE